MVLKNGKFTAAAREGGIGYVTREDCARAAACALASTVCEKETLDITGPEVVTYQDLTKIISEVTGIKVEYVHITPEDLLRALLERGLPSYYAEMLVSFDIAIDEGLLGITSNAVAKLTGKEPESVKDFLLRNRDKLFQEEID